MPSGFSAQIMKRLWKLIQLLRDFPGISRSELRDHLKVEDRVFSQDMQRLRELGIEIKYKRSVGGYQINWPEKTNPIRLTPEQLFSVRYAISMLAEQEKAFAELDSRLNLAINTKTEPVYDCGPAYGISNHVTESIAEILIELKNSIIETRKVVFDYVKPSSKSEQGELRAVHPYRLLHSPISWYLAAWCEDRQDFRTFKLARINRLRVMNDKFKPRPFNIKAYLGDAWWVQWDPNKTPPYQVEVLFKGEAAQTIREYRFHPSQQIELRKDGSLVTWQLSYLGEFASWLMQWLGQIEIKNPQELISSINDRLKSYKNISDNKTT